MTKTSLAKQPVHGIILLDKPPGLTSNAALQKVKRACRAQKAGHTGALDPMATGMLPLCFGEATKFAQQGLMADKQYTFTLKLGQQTDTGDETGTVCAEKPIPALTPSTIEPVLKTFLGPQSQIPPMYSALKHQGQPLYKKARAGETVVRPPRQIIIHALTLIDFTPTQLTAQVSCSKGTYVRVLGEDIAQQLGTVGHLSALRRDAVAPFTAQTPLVSLSELESTPSQNWQSWLLPVNALLAHCPKITLDDAQKKQLQHGQLVENIDINDRDVETIQLFHEQYFLGTGQIEDGVLTAKRLIQPSLLLCG